jgi:serine/threonine-protein phosphatase 2A regulatory subunit B
MHPKSDSMFLYGMSKGSLKLGDLRISANGESNSICFKTSGQKNFLLNLISNISSATFTKNCKYIVSRDYMTVKIWDVCNTKKPVNSILLHEGMKSKLCEMA